MPRDAKRSLWPCAVALGVLAVTVNLGYFSAVDSGVEQWVAQHRTAQGTAVAQAVTFFGDSSWVLGVMAVMSLWWWRTGRPRLAAVLWGAWFAGLMIQVALRYAVAQWRPDVVALPASMTPALRYDLAGFTSGHGFRSAFLYGWWAQTLRRRGSRWAAVGALAAQGLLVLVGLTRIYLQRHWVTDVLGAWVLAALVLSAAARWRRRVTTSTTA